MLLESSRLRGFLHPQGGRASVGRCMRILACSFLAGCCVDLPDARLERTYGGVGNDIAFHAIGTDDGAFLLVGTSEPEGGGPADASIRKVSNTGQTLFVQSFGGARTDIASHAGRVSAGGYVIAGSTASQGSGGTDMFLLRIDDSGTELWSQTFGGAGDDAAFSVLESTMGAFFCGYTEPLGAGGRDMYLVKTARSAISSGSAHSAMWEAIPVLPSLRLRWGYIAVGESDSGAERLWVCIW